MEPEEVGRIVRRFASAWKDHDIEALMALVSDDCVYDASVGSGPGERFVGRDQVRAGITRMLAHDESSDEPSELICVDSRRAVMLWTLRTRLRGEIRPVRGCDVFRVESGLITRKDAFRKCLE